MRLIKFLFFLVILVGLAGAGVAGLAVWYFGRDLPDYQQLATYQPPIITRVLAGDGRLMAEYATEKRVFVPITAMPPLVIDAFLAAEDRNFYSHPGVDPASMARAALTDFLRMGSNRRPEGASTITQQVAKNFLLNNQLSLERKVREALVAIRMEQVLSKDRILELYLNGIYLGEGSYGVAEAALNYFNSSLDQLTVAQAAFLGALPKAPNNYNPTRYPDAALARRDWVIDRMADAHFITGQQATTAKTQPLTLHHRGDADMAHAPYFTEEVRRELLARYGEKGLYQSGLTVRTSLDPVLQGDAVTALRGALIAYDRRHGYRGPVTRIATAGDWQQRLAAVPVPAGAADAGWRLALVLGLRDGASIGFSDGSRGVLPLSGMRWARRYYSANHVGPAPGRVGQVLAAGDVVLVSPLAGEPEATVAEPEAAEAPERAGHSRRGRHAAPVRRQREAVYGLRQIPAVSGGFIALDPHTGRVLAEVGGFSFDISQFDRVTQAMRQTGSAIKPFVYLAALDHGYTPSTIVVDGPFSAPQGPGLPMWNPTNFEHRFFGPVPLMYALAESLNLVTARVGTTVGLPIIAQYYKRFGVIDNMPMEDSYILGAGDTTLLKLAAGYAMIDNGGKRIKPSFIDRVQDRNGINVYRADQRVCDKCNGIPWTGQAPPELPDPREQIADPRSTYQDVTMMEGVVQRGTGKSISSLGRPLAGKTGTTNESKDAWFVGFSPDLVAGAYIGFDQPSTLGKRETGASVAAPAFKEFMAAALKDQPAVPFRIPPGLLMVRVNPHNGRIASAGDPGAIYEAYKPGTEPGAVKPGVVASSDDLNGSADPVGGTDPAGVTGPGDPNAVEEAPPGADAIVPEDGGLAPPPTAPAGSQQVPSSGTGGLY